MLLEPYKLNERLKLQNKVVMAPLTRSFANDDLTATLDMVAYYEKRADVGLIITEATVVSKLAQGYPNTPGIFSEKHVNAWEKVNKTVQNKGAKIFCQLFHAGRLSHEAFHGQQPVAPSAVAYQGRIPRTKNLQYGMPRTLDVEEVKIIVSEFVEAAKLAVKASFDGVEIHGANGYILDQFLHKQTNKRQDEYGGSIENRSRFVLEILDGIIEAIGRERVGIRLSPHAYLHMEHTEGDENTFKYLLKEIEKRDIAYVHTGIYNDHEVVDYLGGKVSQFIRNNYKGTVIANGSYSVKEGTEAINKKEFDLLAFGRSIIANPDIVKKIKNNEPLLAYNNSMLTKLN